MEDQPVSAVGETWRLTFLSVPIALGLWLCAFLAARAVQGSPALLGVLYAPLALLGVRAAAGGGLLLHLAYAACADLAAARRVHVGWLAGLAGLHWVCVAVALSGPLSGSWRSSVAAWVGLVLFLGWHALLAARLARRAPLRGE